MPLEKYKQKRDFNKSPEPVGGMPDNEKLRFVVQKHQASHLHYDFRIELKGVLKSWAVPKGLSMNASESRLAMLVEDHPWDYREFEGIIPSGYGAGTVMVWDEGTYETDVIDQLNKKLQEHSISTQFWKGSIKITLYGHKLKGSFLITKAKDKNENSWYIRKVKDKFESKEDITKKNKSVLSKMTLDQISKNASKKWEGGQSKSNQVKTKSRTTIKAVPERKLWQVKGVKVLHPPKPEAMTCTLIKAAFSNINWVFELKLDGYRIMAEVKHNKIAIYSRSGLNYTKKYPVIIKALKGIKNHVIIDGEVVVLDENGKPNFDKLQKYQGHYTLAYFVFDLLWIDGYDIKHLDLLQRKDILKSILPESDSIKFTDHFENGKELFSKISSLELEGIVAKRKDSIYEPGKRSKNWLKLPTEIRQEFVIGGWTESDHSKSFKSLLFGAYNETNEFICVGHAGGGFKDNDKKEILKKIKKLEISTNPFSNKIDSATRVHYIQPKLVANFKFATWTSSGKIRKPAIFLGFRDDKDAKNVSVEIPLNIATENEVIKNEAESVEPTKEQFKSNWELISKENITSQEPFLINEKEIVITNVEKELWKGVTKADVIKYYHSISSYLLPYLKDRPQSLHIKPTKPTAPGFYIKDMEGKQPQWAEVFNISRKHRKKDKRNEITYLLCQDEAALLYMVNLGCIDINPWNSRTSNYLEPDYIIIDLDPSDHDFGKVIQTSIASRRIFDKLKIKAFPKTSGKTGMHIYVPCEKITFPEARTIAKNICELICKLVPNISTTENNISKRGDKLFIDYNQNDEADTVAAPYCVRPAGQPTVSTPLQWKEINEKLSISNFTIDNILERVEKKGDLFKGVMDRAIKRSNTLKLKKLLI